MKNNKGLFLIIFLLLVQFGFAQKNLNQVYSKYGIGELVRGGTVRNISMGGTGIASPSMYSINDKNPALMVYNSAVGFEFNFKNEFRKSKNTNSELYKDNEAEIGDIRMSFPILKNKWQTCLNIAQYSKSNYNLFETSPIGLVSENMTSYDFINGQGGLNQIGWKNGIKITKKLNFGLDLSYYLGNQFDKRISYVKNEDGFNQQVSDLDKNKYIVASNSVLSVVNYDKVYSGLSATPSFSFLKTFDSLNIDVFIGGKYDVLSNIKANSLIQSDKFYGNSIYQSDTLNESNTNVSIPKGFGLGLSIITKDDKKNNLMMFTFDYSQSKYEVTSGSNYTFSNYAFGVEKFANLNSNSFISRNLYRFGGYYTQNVLVYQNIGINEFGITFGLGIPMRPSINDRSLHSILDFGFTLGSHGGNQNTIKESFFRLNVGFTFNDRWFHKIRIN